MNNQNGAGENHPCADAALLVPLKRSALYGAIRKRVADLKPVDSWQEDGVHYFVFQLKPEGETTAEAPVAIFTMHPEVREPVTGVVVTPSSTGAEAEITDLRNPETAYTAPVDDARYTNNRVTVQVSGMPPEHSEPEQERPDEQTQAALMPDAAEVQAPQNGYHQLDGDLQVLAVAHTAGAEEKQASPSLNGHQTLPEGQAPGEPAIASEPRMDEGKDMPAQPAAPDPLDLLKQSPEYREALRRGATTFPTLSWEKDGVQYFAFQLPAPMAVIAMQPGSSRPVSANIVTPTANGEVVEALQSPLPEIVPKEEEQVIDGWIETEQISDGTIAMNGFAKTGFAPNNGNDNQESKTLLVDMQLLNLLQDSVEFRELRLRGVNPNPVDAWPEDDLHFFVFQLQDGDDTQAVFAMRPGSREPVSAVIVKQNESDPDPQVIQLGHAEDDYKLLI